MAPNLPLTSARFLAALLVVFHHTASAVWARSDTPGYVNGFLDQAGYIGVGFFFVLSGYVLAGAYADRIEGIPNRTFWGARFARIYPVFFLSLVIDVPRLLLYRIARDGAFLAWTKTTVNFVAEGALIAAWAPSVFLAINFPTWSISVEAFFYAVFPAFSRGLLRLRPCEIFLIAALAYFAALACACAAFLVDTSLAQSSHEGSLVVYMFQYNPLIRLPEFIIGVCLRLSVARMSPTAALVALLTGIAAVGAFPFVANSIPFIVKHSVLLGPIYGTVIVGLSFSSGLVRRTLSLPWLVQLGHASYSLYLWHIPLWSMLLATEVKITPLAYVQYLAALTALSLASFRFIETPARRYLTRQICSLKPSSILNPVECETRGWSVFSQRKGRRPSSPE